MASNTSSEIELLKQREIIAKFGELALRSDDLDEILGEACRLVEQAFGWLEARCRWARRAPKRDFRRYILTVGTDNKLPVCSLCGMRVNLLHRYHAIGQSRRR